MDSLTCWPAGTAASLTCLSSSTAPEKPGFAALVCPKREPSGNSCPRASPRGGVTSGPPLTGARRPNVTQLRFKGHAYAKPSGRGLVLELSLTPAKLNGSSGGCRALSACSAQLGQLEQFAGAEKCLCAASCAGTASRSNQIRRYARQGVKLGRKCSGQLCLIPGVPCCPRRGDERAGVPLSWACERSQLLVGWH